VDVIHLEPDDPLYPARLQARPKPPNLSALGNLELLQHSALAIFCSSKCPGSLILRAQDVAKELVIRGTTVVSGFHSSVEREVQRVLLRGENPLIVCPARGLSRMRVPVEYHAGLEAGRLLLLSAFPDTVTRVSEDSARRRSYFVADLADRALIIHASLTGSTQMLAQRVLADKKAVFTLKDQSNDALIQLGASIWENT
jgi:predicted Rossmann fold nucleotide-binding protein DprA/Smf involved in DNA uptake